MKIDRTREISIALLLALFAAITSAIQRGSCIDDAYVSFVFARNWAEGAGLVFNLGDKIEGYSNFLWVILLGSLYRFGFSIPETAQTLGIILGAINTLLVYRIARNYFKDNEIPFHIAAAFFVAVDLRIAAWNVEGLETPFYLFWILAAFNCYMSENKFRYLWGVACLGAALTRLEGVFVFASIYAALIADKEKSRSRLTEIILSTAVFVIGFVVYNIWRFDYFGGEIMSNTYYARGAAGVKVGLLYIVFELWKAYGPVAILLLFFAVSGAIKKIGRYSPIAIWVVVDLIYVASQGGDWMPNARFLVPVLPFVFILFIAGVSEIKSKKIRIAAITLMACTQIAGGTIYEIGHSFDKRWARDQVEFYSPVAEKLESLKPAGELVAFSDVGYVTYRTRIKIIDTLGLVDRHLARMKDGPQWTSDIDYVIGRNPLYVVNMVRHYGNVELGHTAFDREIPANESFRQKYELIDSIPGYSATERSWDDFKIHDYTVEFRIWRRRGI